MMLLAVLLACSRTVAPEVAPTPAPTPAPLPAAEVVSVDAGLILAESGGLRLVEHTWTLGASQGWLWVATMPRDAALTIHPSASVRKLATFPPAAEGEVLLNGGFYDNGAMGLVAHEGTTHTARSPGGGSGILYADGGPMDVVHRDAWGGSAQEGVQSIDRIVDGGASVVTKRPNVPRTSRVAVAVREDAVMAIVAGGEPSTQRKERQMHLGASEHDGLPLWAFADAVVALGAERALNLDGGISTEATVQVGGQVYTVTGGVGTINAVRLSATPQ